MMAAGWDADATKALISIWGQEKVQNQLNSITRNRIIYEKNCAEVGSGGVHLKLATMSNRNKKPYTEILQGKLQVNSQQTHLCFVYSSNVYKATGKVW